MTLTLGFTHATVLSVAAFLVEVPALKELLSSMFPMTPEEKACLWSSLDNLPCQCQVCRYQRVHGQVQEDELPF